MAGYSISSKYPRMKNEEKVPYEWVLAGQFDKALSAYRQAKEQKPDHFTMGEGYINQLGYQLIEDQDIKKAIDMFRINTILYPKSANAFDSLAEAYKLNGEKELAKTYYLRSLELDPKNTNAIKMIQDLNKRE